MNPLKISESSRVNVKRVLDETTRALSEEAETCGYTRLVATVDIEVDRQGLMRAKHRCSVEKAETGEFGEFELGKV